MTFPSRLSALFVCATLLAGCAGQDGARRPDAAPIAFAPHSVQVWFTEHNVELNGHASGPAMLTAAQLQAMLGQWVTQGVSSGLGDYVTDHDPAYQLNLQIEAFTMGRDGSLYATVTMTVQRNGGDIILQRTVQAGRRKDDSDAVLARQLTQRVLANLRGAGLAA